MEEMGRNTEDGGFKAHGQGKGVRRKGRNGGRVGGRDVAAQVIARGGRSGQLGKGVSSGKN
jgi:hypothetical protein